MTKGRAVTALDTDSTTTVTLTIDGRSITVPKGTTIWEAAKQNGIDIPVLCHDERMEPVGVCRMCVVDVGARVLAASCVRACEDGMEVKTSTPVIDRSRSMLTELLMADQPESDPKESSTGGNELLALAREYDVDGSRFAHENSRPTDDSSPVIAVNHQACIMCDRCIRGCDDLQSNEVIGRTGKGYTARIAFDLDNPMGDSTCVSLWRVRRRLVPTGALVNKPITTKELAKAVGRSSTRSTASVPYCGVGCALTYHVDKEKNTIVYAEGRESPGNEARLCVKGRYGWGLRAAPAAFDPGR